MFVHVCMFLVFFFFGEHVWLTFMILKMLSNYWMGLNMITWITKTEVLVTCWCINETIYYMYWICWRQRLRLITQTWGLISRGNKTEWSPIVSVIILVITKLDNHGAGVQFAFEKKGKVCIKRVTKEVCKLFLWWLKPKLWLVDLNYNFECDWLIELSNNNLASELVESRSF